jgi:hypothetical protein
MSKIQNPFTFLEKKVQYIGLTIRVFSTGLFSYHFQ